MRELRYRFAMTKVGEFGAEVVRHFNGALFADTDDIDRE